MVELKYESKRAIWREVLQLSGKVEVLLITFHNSRVQDIFVFRIKQGVVSCVKILWINCGLELVGGKTIIILFWKSGYYFEICTSIYSL